MTATDLLGFEQSGPVSLTSEDRGERFVNVRVDQAAIERDVQVGLAGHLLDPEMIAPGLRDAPATNEHDNSAILAALARGRSGSVPVLSSEESVPVVLFNRNCLRCHVMGSVGGNEGPKLTSIGAKMDEARIVKQITSPLAVNPIAEMPAFEGKLTAEEIHTLAQWLSRKK